MTKTENTIWANVITYLTDALLAQGYSDWQAKQSDQPIAEGLENKSVYITRIASRRYGWQGHQDYLEDDVMKHKETYFQEVLFQVSAYKQRTDDITEITSGDVLNSLITYSQSLAGVKALQALGYETIRIASLREPTITTDSELYEKLPSFDIFFVLKQNEISVIGSTTQINITTRGL